MMSERCGSGCGQFFDIKAMFLVDQICMCWKSHLSRLRHLGFI